MIFTVTIGTARYDADLCTGYSIAIPLDFHGAQPNAYGVPPAEAWAFEGGGFIGDTRRGGSCNFETLSLTPHCNGTHTECIGHLTRERVSIERILPGSLMPATLITVPLLPSSSVAELYSCELEAGDSLITRAALRQVLDRCKPAFLRALILRTLPNPPGKTTRQYDTTPAPFFTHDAIEEIVERGVQHLLVDVPSLDRSTDGGRLSAHRTFWGLAADATDAVSCVPAKRTVTEMIFVPDHIQDGLYLLDLQIAPFVSDAAPSRPILFPISPRP